MRSANDSQATGHVFVDNVRFWSMLSIVALHSVQVFGQLKQSAPIMKLVLMTPFKFGTIGFFLISGFLMGDGLSTTHPGQYMKKRLKKIFLPWLCWFTLMLVYMFLVNQVHQHAGIPFNREGLRLAAKFLYMDMFYTAFWFVPNLLLGLYVLLLFRRHVDDVRLGAALLAINLLYVANIYGRWLPTIHSEAVLGFVFYLWLGGYAARRYGRLTAWLEGVPMAVLVGAAVAGAGCALAEGLWLMRSRMEGANTLRLSNQVFSVLVVLVFVRMKTATWPRFVKVRQETFGLYLSHALLLAIVMRLASKAPRSWLPSGHVGMLMEWLAVFAVVYGTGITMARGLAGWDATRWLVGLSPARTASVEIVAGQAVRAESVEIVAGQAVRSERAELVG